MNRNILLHPILSVSRLFYSLMAPVSSKRHKDRTEIKAGSALLQRCSNVLSIVCASTKVNSNEYCTSLSFLQVAVCRALFIFSDVLFPQWHLGIFHFITLATWNRQSCESNNLRHTAEHRKARVLSIAFFDFFVRTEATLLFMMRTTKRYAVQSISDRIQFDEVSIKITSEMNRVELNDCNWICHENTLLHYHLFEK